MVVDTVTCMGTKSGPMKERENDRRTRRQCMAAAAALGGWGVAGLKKKFKEKLPDVKLEKSEAVQVQFEHVGGSFWVVKNGSGIRMGDGKQGRRGMLWEKRKKKIKKGRGWKSSN